VGAALAGGCGSTSNDPNSAPSTRTDAIVIAEGRQWAHKFYEGDTEALWNQFTLDKQSSLKSKQSLDDWHDLFEGTRGVESQVLDEQVERTSQLATYVRFATFEYSGTRRAIRIGFDESGKIGVFDIAIVENGKTYRTTGKENADYLCFGQPVLAPGAGTVVGVGDGVEDNAPGQTPTGEFSIRLLGNHVIIDHGESEFSFIIHLMNGSTQVKVGDRVDAGAPVGLCGNSGSATEPHLHYHLQNTGVFAHGDGLPAQFRNYTSNGTFVESGEPVRQERVINGRE
jgi:hypothetical protein